VVSRKESQAGGEKAGVSPRTKEKKAGVGRQRKTVRKKKKNSGKNETKKKGRQHPGEKALPFKRSKKKGKGFGSELGFL